MLWGLRVSPSSSPVSIPGQLNLGETESMLLNSKGVELLYKAVSQLPRCWEWLFPASDGIVRVSHLWLLLPLLWVSWKSLGLGGLDHRDPDEISETS